MKKIVIISNFQSVSVYHKAVLDALFEEQVEILPLSFEQHIFNEAIDADILLISLYSIYVGVQEYVKSHTKVIVLSNTITEAQYGLIRQIPPHQPVLLVNYSPEMTLEILALFRQIGLTDYDFIPYYPGKNSIPPLKYAVTPGEADKVPNFVEKIIDIGHRTLDVRTITDIAVELGKEELLNTPPFIAHFKTLMKTSNAVSSLLGRVNNIESRFFKLLNYIDEGILFTSNDGALYSINNKAMEVLHLNESHIGENLIDLIPNDYIRKAIGAHEVLDHQLIRIHDCNVVFNAWPVLTAGEITSILMTFNRFEEKEKSQHKLRVQILGKGHRAKYHFDQIVGESDVILKTKEIAKKMALSNASVLITGESGTGKELFAQAIHNSSNRKDYQFVAINCATIPENLLESELFGYEEGAFSGARKGGKIGLFELAHRGTIFLDEIGEMPIHLQSRLLRVLQEREVMRVGGDAVIHVDVRIIAATNQNLKKLVADHLFRSDLYYRLNVLKLNIPPLRERSEDILLIFNQYKQEIKAQYELTKEAKNYLLQYRWEGNVRALRNSVEYLSYLDTPLIETNHLVAYLEDEGVAGDGLEVQDISPKAIVSSGSMNPERLDRMELSLSKRDFLLKMLYEYRCKLQKAGRRTLFEQAHLQGYFISEGEIRKLLNALEAEGLVQVERGRGGSTLTDEGYRLCKEKFN